MNILKVYLLFWTFSIIGWILEVVVCSISDKRIVNRGFLIGPYCPIYGFGAVIMLTLSPYKNYPFVTFIFALFLCSVLEYFTSFLMEKMFKVRWWDYSNDSFNINGRVCLRNAIAFGALGVLFTKYLNPLFFSYVDRFDEKTLTIVSLIVFVITLIDIIISFKAMESIKLIVNKNINSLKNKDATMDIKRIIRNSLIKPNYLQRRLIKTYHLLEKEKDNLKNKIESFNKKSGYGILLTFVFIGTVVGIILSLIFVTDDYKEVIPITISISSLIAIIIIRMEKRQ